jgi:hypothetical protein
MKIFQQMNLFFFATVFFFKKIKSISLEKKNPKIIDYNQEISV